MSHDNHNVILPPRQPLASHARYFKNDATKYRTPNQPDQFKGISWVFLQRAALQALY